jgi:hypothetical protein
MIAVIENQNYSKRINFVHLHCTVEVLVCTQFFESLLQDIDLCQLEATARRFQIGWCFGEIRNECFLVIVDKLVLCSIK